jgi:hypothetical protein
MSQASFDYWKGKHPKTARGYTFASEDIDGDQIPEALVRGADDSILAVNGWQLKPSKAKYTQPTWETQGEARVQHRQEYYDEDLKSIYKQFGKAVVEDAFAAVIKELGRGPISATRKDGSAIRNAKGEQVYRGYSYYSKNVAKILVGNEVDKELMQKYAGSIDQYPQFAGWKQGFPESLANKESPAAKAAAYLRRSREYKQELKSGLGAMIAHQDPTIVRNAVKAAIGIDRGTILPEAAAIATLENVAAMAQEAVSGES